MYFQPQRGSLGSSSLPPRLSNRCSKPMGVHSSQPKCWARRTPARKASGMLRDWCTPSLRKPAPAREARGVPASAEMSVGKMSLPSGRPASEATLFSNCSPRSLEFCSCPLHTLLHHPVLPPIQVASQTPSFASQRLPSSSASGRPPWFGASPLRPRPGMLRPHLVSSP